MQVISLVWYLWFPTKESLHAVRLFHLCVGHMVRFVGWLLLPSIPSALIPEDGPELGLTSIFLELLLPILQVFYHWHLIYFHFIRFVLRNYWESHTRKYIAVGMLLRVSMLNGIGSQEEAPTLYPSWRCNWNCLPRISEKLLPSRYVWNFFSPQTIYKVTFSICPYLLFRSVIWWAVTCNHKKHVRIIMGKLI